MSGFSTLRRVLAIQERTEAQETTRRFPPLELRFALEYPAPPDLAAERRAIAQLLESDGFILQPLFAGDDPELARILVLRFPKIERTLSLPSLAVQAAARRSLIRSLKPALMTMPSTLGAPAAARTITPFVTAARNAKKYSCWISSSLCLTA